jgi:hypothetical protein
VSWLKGCAFWQLAHRGPQHGHQVIRHAVERGLGPVERPQGDRLGGADEDVRERVELLGVGLAPPARQLAPPRAR